MKSKLKALKAGLLISSILYFLLFFGGLYHLFRIWLPIGLSLLLTTIFIIVNFLFRLWCGDAYDESKNPNKELLDLSKKTFESIKAKSSYFNDFSILVTDSEVFTPINPADSLFSKKQIVLANCLYNKDYYFNETSIGGIIAHECGHCLSGLINKKSALLFSCTTIIGFIELIGEDIINHLIDLRRKCVDKDLIFMPLLIECFCLVFLILCATYCIPLIVFLSPFTRKDEYFADQYSCEIGYGESLKYFLYKNKKYETFLSRFFDCFQHPSAEKRISKICKCLGYSKK